MASLVEAGMTRPMAVETVKTTLEATPPELAADLVDSGVVMAGGGSLLRGLDRVIAEEIDLPVRVAEDPLTAVARGTGVFLEKIQDLRIAMDESDD